MYYIEYLFPDSKLIKSNVVLLASASLAIKFDNLRTAVPDDLTSAFFFSERTNFTYAPVIYGDYLTTMFR
jgi:hypothetical protein